MRLLSTLLSAAALSVIATGSIYAQPAQKTLPVSVDKPHTSVQNWLRQQAANPGMLVSEDYVDPQAEASAMMAKPRAGVNNPSYQGKPVEFGMIPIGVDKDYKFETQAGIYSFKSDYGEAQYLGSSPNAAVNTAYSGGAKCDDKIIIITSTTYNKAGWVIVDANTYEVVRTIENNKDGLAPAATTTIAWNSVDKKLYGIFRKKTSGSQYELCSVDIESLERTVIANLGTAKYAQFAINSKGEMFAFNSAGKLSKYDADTKKFVEIGASGISFSVPFGVTLCDQSTDMLYAICAKVDKGNVIADSLYVVDTTTGVAKGVREMPGHMLTNVLWVRDAQADDAAPNCVANLALDFAEGAHTGKICFTLPDVTYVNGEAQTSIGYVVTANGEVIFNVEPTADLKWGQRMELEWTVPKSGIYNISVTPVGRHGNGPAQFIEAWIGPDATQAPTDVVLTYSQENKQFELTWKAPTKSANDGYIDWTKVTYDIYDINAQLVKSGLDTCFYAIPDANPDPNGKWRYSVVANHMGEKSLSGVSNLVGMNSAPYHEDFTNGDNFHDWTVEDIDNDLVTWTWPYNYTPAAQHQVWIHGARYKVINDWLFTPALRLEAGKEYDLYLEIEGEKYCSDQLGVFIGSDVKSSAMTECIMPYTYIENTTDKKNMIFKINIRVPETKVYYIGLHAKGYQEYSGGFNLEDFRLEAGLEYNAPGMGTFSVAPDPSPSVKLEATITYVTPDTTIVGGKIEALTKVEFYRDEQLIKTFENPAPGTTLSFLDTNITLGDHQWRVKPYSAVGEGKNILADAYVGIRMAGEMGAIKITEMGNSGVITLSWEAPKTDVEGNELDPNQVYYHVYKPGGLFLESVAYSEPGETSMMLNTRISTQAFMTYYVGPVTAAGENKNTRKAAEYTPLGTPYMLPFVESAPSIRVQHNWAMGGNTSEKWQVSAASGTPKCDPQDNDGGMWVWVPVGDGAWSRLSSGKVYVTGSNPIATFFYRAMSDCTDTMEFQVREIGQDNWTTLKTIVFNETGKDDWVKVVVPVADYVGKNVQFGWLDVCHSTPQVHCLDNINIAEAVANEAKINSVVIPSKVEINDQLNVTVAIENLGTEAIKEVNVTLTRDGEVVATAEPFALGFGERKQIILTDNELTMFLPNKLSYRVEVTLVNANGESSGVLSDKYEVELLKPFQPVVDDLSATKTNAGTQLTWSAPKNATENPDHYFTDDVEPYPSYVPDQAGKWTFVDVDKSSTAGIGGISFPYLHTPYAWIVNDATHPGFNETWEAHSGNKYFMSMSANNGKPNDDWMISPLLSGVEQNLSFWAKSYNTYYGDEEFEVLYSTTGKDIADFTKIGYDTVPMAWTKFEFTIPEGAKYFAIRNMGYDHWVLQIDDITYNQGGGKLELLGYNVYRNDEKINDKLITETSFIDEESTSTRDVWYVTAVYDLGESDISNAAKIGTTSLDDVVGEGISVAVEGSDIVITGAEGSDIAVYATSGITVYAGTGEAVTRVSIDTVGVYLVQINGKAVKVSVK